MGVYVPNKSKPEKCAMCPAYRLMTVPTFWDDPDPFQKVEAHCVLLDKHIESINEVLDDCPLIEVDDDLMKKLQESAIVIKAVFNRLKKMVNDSDELKAELMGTNTNLVMFDEPNPTQRNVELYSGCRDCSYELKCPDAFTDVAPLCNGYKGAVK